MSTDRSSSTALDTTVAGCAHGPSLRDPCAACDQEADQLDQAFEADVAAGIYDAAGYMPKERAAQGKRWRVGAGTGG